MIVPLFPSHFSALGMLLADKRHDFIRTYYADLAGADFAKLIQVHDEMVAEAEGGCVTRGAPCGRCISICATPARNSPCGAGHAGAAKEGRPPRHPRRLRQAL